MNWDLVIDGMKSIHLLRACNNLPEKYGDDAIHKTIGKVWTDTYKGADLTHRLLNPSVLMMAAYLYFVYPKESLKEIDLTNISIENFTIIKGSYKDKNNFLHRLRNSIAHAKYQLLGERLIFQDYHKTPTEKKFIEFDIDIVKFGAFLEQFRLEVYRQKLG